MRSPAKPTFKPLVKHYAVVNVGPSHLGQSVAAAEDVAKDDAARAKPYSTSEDENSSAFGQGGQLFPDGAERDVLWRRRFDDLESTHWFDDEKVEYVRLLADSDVAGSEQLVMKWDDW
ncbi:hypothetical protein FRC04_006990 [Tulasnella sp. 424]|nr:hypothetical protein FRC04_006990 [Tulasnella sp. 424]